jgi:hypothetical protein
MAAAVPTVQVLSVPVDYMFIVHRLASLHLSKGEVWHLQSGRPNWQGLAFKLKINHCPAI